MRNAILCNTCNAIYVQVEVLYTELFGGMAIYACSNCGHRIELNLENEVLRKL